jgi:hypothetical protein
MAKKNREHESKPQAGSKPKHGAESAPESTSLGSAPRREPQIESQIQPQIQGEGDYEAARRYRTDIEDFVEEEGEDGIARKAEDARRAVEGDEGDALRRAEKTGEGRARG